MAEITITRENFQTEVLESPQPALVDFWASWCGPCRMIAPVIKEIADEYSKSARVCKVNIDEQPDLAERFGVMSIPTVILFKNGQIKDTVVGFRSKEELKAMLDSVMVD